MAPKPWLRWMGLLGAVAVMALVPSVQAEKGPRRMWSKPVLVSKDLAHRETSIAINPSERSPKTIFVCDPSGVPNTEHNQSYFHISHDGGKKWEYVRVENEFSDTRNYFFEGGDCDVAMDSAGTLYTADTWLGDLSIGHSTDGGKTWSGTALAGTSPMVDRPWLVAGEEGTLYVTYHDLQCCTPSAIWFTKSTDYGQTFSPAVPITTFAGDVPPDPSEGPDGAYTWEGNFVVAGEGQDLYLVYTRRQAPALTEQSGAETVNVAISHDGGASWNSERITSTDGPASYLYPSIGMDGGGGLHVVYSSAGKRDHPIWYSYSTTKGQKWSKPVPLARGGAGFSPWIAGGAKPGEAAVVWYGSPNPDAGSEVADWYFYTARVAHVNGGKLAIGEVGPTTAKPIFTGRQTVPEFEMVRLDREGNMHIGMSAFREDPVTKRVAWAIYYQRQHQR